MEDREIRKVLDVLENAGIRYRMVSHDPVYTIEEIGYLIRLSLGHSDPKAAYDDFCDCAEAAVSHAFHQTTMERDTKAGDPRLLLWNACNAFACQLYVRRIYLEDAMARPAEE